MFLERIVQYKKEKLIKDKEKIHLSVLSKNIFNEIPRNVKENFTREKVSIIAEVKKASPSKGIICKILIR